MVLYNIVPGIDTNLSTKLNYNFASTLPTEIYVGTGFDSEAIVSAGDTSTVTEEHTFNIDSSTITNATYVLLKVGFRGYARAKDGGNRDPTAYGNLKIQVAEIGSTTFASDVNEQVAYANTKGNYDDPGDTSITVGTLEWYHELSPGEITNGLQLRIETTSYGNNGATSRVTNIQTTYFII